MIKMRLPIFSLILIAISSRVIFGEVANPVFHLLLLSITCTLLAIILNREKLFYYLKQKIFILPTITLIIFLILQPQFIFLRLILLVLFFFFIGKILQPFDSNDSSILWTSAITTLMLAVFIWIYNAEPLVWNEFQIITQNSSSFLGYKSDQKILLSVTASGLMITLLNLFFGIVILVLSTTPQKTKFFIYVFAIALCNAVFIIYLHRLTYLFQFLLKDISVEPMNILFFLFIIEGIPLWWFLRRIPLGKVSFNFIPQKRIPLIISIICIILISIIIYNPQIKKIHPSKTILIYDHGLLNWDKPVFGKYGLNSCGMFGMLPEYIETMGYNIKIDSVFNEANLKNVSAVVVINLNKFLQFDEKKLLVKFIKDGGSLLVMGDHTGLGGIMEPLNDLLSFVKIKFNFDCGHYLKDNWKDDFDYTNHPIFNESLDNLDVGISVGASLNISSLTAKPVLIAKYGFSDEGNILNSQGAFLGNRQYDPGELLGDILLAAEASYGEGKILVFGDTSSFQNGSLAYTYHFVQRVFIYLIDEGNFWNNKLLFRVILIFLLLIAIISFFYTKPFTQTYSTFWIVLTILVISQFNFLLQKKESSIIKSNKPIAYINNSHLNQFSQYRDDGIWALTYHLMRNGFLPIIDRNSSSTLLDASSAAFFITSSQSLNQNNVEEIDTYIKNGGNAILSFGYEEKEPFEVILRKYGFDEDNIPLGPIPDSETTANVQFSKAWPILIKNHKNVDTLCEGWNFPVIVSKMVGKGNLILVADPLFFLSENLEANHHYPHFDDLFKKFISDNYYSDDSDKKITQVGLRR